ncbi:hypothetical protein CBER1_06871 [Cercospora berteroae]|uniref:alpha-L-fucosidase n=1 Tax=Cercospora berteroae TaxID=357750 RepID=A0A2S6C4T9_9PEZI|nr:hypothetical protein CBER1_06871 [Cercospora berteroae]
MRCFRLVLGQLGLTTLVLGQGGLVVNPKSADDNEAGAHARSITIDLSDLVNNRAFAVSPGDADFDGVHSGYPAEYIPRANLTYAGTTYDFPQYRETGDDNVLAQGQVITPPAGKYFSIHMLAAAETAIATGNITTTYADNSTTVAPILVDPFWAWPYPYGGDIIFPYYLTNESIDYNRSMIFQTISWIDSTKEITSIKLPNVTAGSSSSPGGAAEETRLHIFAISLVPAEGTGINVDIQHARSTSMWMEGTNKTQIFSVKVNNLGDEWILAENGVQVTVEGPGIETVVPGTINRLGPGDQATVNIGVVNQDGTDPGTPGQATVRVSGTGVNVSSNFNATFGIGPYEATYESIYSHESPAWFNNGKYGIFIHWGVYSVPGWGNVGDKEQYAEWYWWYMNQGENQTKGEFWEYNLATYGPDHNYDDFIPQFTADAYDPKEWVDLFADAGAQYFVQVSKHHEGYAIFDIPSNITNRTSVALPPHKNLLQMLFDAADQYQPQLHKATYFSTPEWFHPDYKEYGFGSWPGGNATNPYTNGTLPYTGYVPIDDFITDLMVPEMQILADMGTEIMWCDIGGPNMTAEWAAKYFNDNAAKGREVSINARCGLPGDFDTPEYAKYDAVQMRKWESNLGMDPYSYGYNRATPIDAYMKPDVIVTSLIDIVSKNGNFLLDIGPMANGTILQVEQDNLRAAGKWIKSHGEAIFNTTYWFITPQEGETIRFTQTPEAFYVLTLYPPNATLVLDSPVPYVQGDEIRVVGGNMSGTVVPSRLLENGSLELRVSEEVRDADMYSWVFKIALDGGNGTTNGTSDGGSSPAQQTGGVGNISPRGVNMAGMVLLATAFCVL